MGKLWLPDSRLEMPELLEPGRKPVGNVKIDWTHPLAKRLEEYCLFGDTYDSASGLNVTSSLGVKKNGKSVDFSAPISYLRYSPFIPKIDEIGKISICTRLFLSSTADDQILIEKSIDIFTDGWVLFFDAAGPNGARVFDFYVATSVNSSRASPSNSHSTGWYDIVATFDSDLAAAARVKIYVNAVDETDGIADGTGAANSGGVGHFLQCGMHSTVSDRRYFDGLMDYMAIFSRALSSQEALTISRSPYQFLIPA